MSVLLGSEFAGGGGEDFRVGVDVGFGGGGGHEGHVVERRGEDAAVEGVGGEGAVEFEIGGRGGVAARGGGVSRGGVFGTGALVGGVSGGAAGAAVFPAHHGVDP